MNCVDRVKQLCKEQKVPISRLEKDLGFSNGYIGQLKKGTLPNDRLVKVAEYLGTTTNYLMFGNETGEERDGDKYYLNDETAQMAQKLFENKELRTLFDAAQDATPEDLKTTYDMLMALKKKERGMNDD